MATSPKLNVGSADSTTPTATVERVVSTTTARIDAVQPTPTFDMLRTLPVTMQAVVQGRYGSADVLGIHTIDVPRPNDGQVLIAVEAAGVDRAVWHLMTGLPWLVRMAGVGFVRPKQPVPGLDVSGRIVALGSSVSNFEVGDEVFGIGIGTFAEYALAEVGKLARRPAGVDPIQAAAMPISGLTALQALRDVKRVEAGQRVLVIGASGGVGVYAVQIARHSGAHDTGVASTAKLDLVRSLGAERVIDYTQSDALDRVESYDLIIDINGRNPILAMRRALKRDGTLVIVGGEGGDRLTGGLGRQMGAMLLSPFVSQRLTGFISKESGEDVARLATLLEAGDLVTPVAKTYALDEAPIAISDLAAGRIREKAVIRVS